MFLYSRGGNETLWAFPNFLGFVEIFELVQPGSFVIFSSPHLKLASALATYSNTERLSIFLFLFLAKLSGILDYSMLIRFVMLCFATYVFYFIDSIFYFSNRPKVYF